MPKETISTGYVVEVYTPPRYKILGSWMDMLKALDKKIPDDDRYKKDVEKLIVKMQKEYKISFDRGDT